MQPYTERPQSLHPSILPDRIATPSPIPVTQAWLSPEDIRKHKPCQPSKAEDLVREYGLSDDVTWYVKSLRTKSGGNSTGWTPNSHSKHESNVTYDDSSLDSGCMSVSVGDGNVVLFRTLGNEYKQCGLSKPYVHYRGVDSEGRCFSEDVLKLEHDDTQPSSVRFHLLPNFSKVPPAQQMRILRIFTQRTLVPLCTYTLSGEAMDTEWHSEGVSHPILMHTPPTRQQLVLSVESHREALVNGWLDTRLKPVPIQGYSDNGYYSVTLNDDGTIQLYYPSVCLTSYLAEWLALHPVARRMDKVKVNIHGVALDSKTASKLDTKHKKEARDSKYRYGKRQAIRS